MAPLLLWLLACVGATLVVTVSRAGAPLRWLLDVVTHFLKYLNNGIPKDGPTPTSFPRCPACVGFWVGLAASRFAPAWVEVVDVRTTWVHALGCAFASSAASWAIITVVNR
jgi:hypothetical protein